MSLRDIEERSLNIQMMFCVPAERIMGRRMIRIEKRSVGTHGAMFTKLMIELICTKRSDGTFKTFIIVEATYDMSLRDIEEKSLKCSNDVCVAAW